MNTITFNAVVNAAFEANQNFGKKIAIAGQSSTAVEYALKVTVDKNKEPKKWVLMDREDGEVVATFAYYYTFAETCEAILTFIR